jgi:hypothetical protein
MGLFYKEPVAPSDSEWQALVNSGDTHALCEAIIGRALNSTDWEATQNEMLDLLHHPDDGIKMTAILGLGHIARIHKTLDVNTVVSVLEKMKNSDLLRGRIEDVLGDIRMFVSTSTET